MSEFLFLEFGGVLGGKKGGAGVVVRCGVR